MREATLRLDKPLAFLLRLVSTGTELMISTALLVDFPILDLQTWGAVAFVEKVGTLKLVQLTA